jgi:hypothetical protein
MAGLAEELKKVSFSYVPAYKDDENRNRKPNRIKKDEFTDVSSLQKPEDASSVV